ncbi:unnamed protein product, partial [Allacma fusca]
VSLLSVFLSTLRVREGLELELTLNNCQLPLLGRILSASTQQGIHGAYIHGVWSILHHSLDFDAELAGASRNIKSGSRLCDSRVHIPSREKVRATKYKQGFFSSPVTEDVEIGSGGLNFVSLKTPEILAET